MIKPKWQERIARKIAVSFDPEEFVKFVLEAELAEIQVNPANYINNNLNLIMEANALVFTNIINEYAELFNDYRNRKEETKTDV